ncbi:MAG: class I poly(R)-hydroxyalkanoic acid synthase [Candidatus Symbiobacter sp.]|nr:class I poly(R)-hydroxyalkanoic acid synthase [Candidatus Symbiobacter sp.]
MVQKQTDAAGAKPGSPAPNNSQPGNPQPGNPQTVKADMNMNDPQWTENWRKIAEQSSKLMADFLKRQQNQHAAHAGDGTQTVTPELGMTDPLHIGQAFMEWATQAAKDPGKMIEAQFNLWQDYMALWQNATLRLMGDKAEPLVSPPKDDRRFKDAAWSENLLFDFIKQSYLLTARWVQAQARDTDGLDKHNQAKLDFFTRQFVDAMAPTNFVLTNPEVLRTTIESGGENLVKGLANLLKDLEKGKGQLAISMTDTTAFKIGENVAISPGKVVFQNDLMQLIQYAPTTANVARRPLLIIPPWINKYYILDLASKNSLVKWAVEQGQTVFMISWVNPDASLAHKSFEDYMIEGPVAAMDAITQATGEKEFNILGYCLGGTLLACTLAWLKSKGDARVKSATFLTTLLDFTEAGELSVFIDEQQLQDLETRMNKTGYLEGQSMAMTFNMLRDNDLIWSFVVNNYLLGKDPFPFDLLYWNSDSTRMPAAMHSFYLRNMYLQNNLAKPGGITLKNVPINLGTVDLPIMMVSTREDHIAPWKSTFDGGKLFGRPPIFVLSGSGHIAGIVNPPAANKYQYWTNKTLAVTATATADAWLESAVMQPGSWWGEWANFLAEFSGGQVPARIPGTGGLKAIEAAPGSYVQLRLLDESPAPQSPAPKAAAASEAASQATAQAAQAVTPAAAKPKPPAKAKPKAKK